MKITPMTHQCNELSFGTRTFVTQGTSTPKAQVERQTNQDRRSKDTPSQLRFLSRIVVQISLGGWCTPLIKVAGPSNGTDFNMGTPEKSILFFLPVERVTLSLQVFKRI